MLVLCVLAFLVLIALVAPIAVKLWRQRRETDYSSYGGRQTLDLDERSKRSDGVSSAQHVKQLPGVGMDADAYSAMRSRTPSLEGSSNERPMARIEIPGHDFGEASAAQKSRMGEESARSFFGREKFDTLKSNYDTLRSNFSLRYRI